MNKMFGFSSLKPWLRGLLCAACVYHIAAMVSANLPFSTAFGQELRRPFAHYIGYVGLWQNWVMFHTIPHFRAVRPMLVARYPGGSETEHGAMLPGLIKYRPRTRMGSLFFRYTWPTNDILPYGRAYLQRACSEVARQTGKRPSTMTLRLDSLRLNSLADARRTGKPGKPASDFSTMNVPCN